VKIAPAAMMLIAGSKVEASLQCTPFAPNGVQQCEAGIDSSLIHKTALQQKSEWCWAACIEMVFGYYGYEVPQKRIVTETWGSDVNMPGQPQQIVADLNRIWQAEDERKFTASGDVYSANAVTAAQDLSQDFPLIIGTMGHAVVLTSLVYLRNAYGGGQVQSAIVRDPWPGKGKRVLAPQEWYSINFASRIRVAAADGDDDKDDN
jgi:ABC-type bacteriocin/lantibiotic exporter with double-glycine peptidase domain